MTDLELEAQYFKDSLFALGKDIAVRIEGKQHDELFWSTIFQIALPLSKPEFYPQCFEYPSSGTTGKDCVLLLEAYVDKELVLCVDSDYDYLLQRAILDKPFIFHTYVYSIENYWCYAHGLPNIVKKVMNTEGVDFDFANFFDSYSNIIYPYLLCSLFSTAEKDNFLNSNQLGDNIGFFLNANLANFEFKLKQKYDVLYSRYASNPKFKALRNRLNYLGLTEKEAYLFVRGHDVFDRVAKPLMKSLVTAHFATLTTNAEKIAYEQQIKAHPYNEVAQKNTSMSDSIFYQRIIQDIQAVFSN